MAYARYLANHGVHALLFDLRWFGASARPGRSRATDDVAAAVGELRRRGARRIALVGASMGGAIAVVAAARLRAAAVVDLSGGVTQPGSSPGSMRTRAPRRGTCMRLRGSSSRSGTGTCPRPDMRPIAHRLRSPTARVIVLPAAAGHGWDTLFGTARQWSPLAATVARFVRHHAR